MTFRQIIKTSLVGTLLVPVFFVSLLALSPMAESNLGVNLVPAAQAACSNGNTTDKWQDAYGNTHGNLNYNNYSSSRLINWAYTISSWCYTYHFASYNGGASWVTPGNGGIVTQVTANADGYANAVIGNSLRYMSCTNSNRTGTCSTTSTGSMNNNLFIDTQTPWAGAHLNTTCFSPGQGVQIIDGGSGDSGPSSGWNTAYGMWYYQASGGADSGWTNNNNWSWTVPTPGYGSQGNYAAYEYIRDNAFNQSAAAGYGFSVDNTVPSGGWISASPSTTSSTSVNLSFAANAGGCAGIDNVAISNNQANWWYSGYNFTYFGGWDFTNANYGGNSNQGTHTIYIAFHEVGAGWAYYQTNVTYDTVGPTGTNTLSIGAAAYANAAFTDNWSIGDPTSGVANAATYVWTRPSTDGAGSCTGTQSGAVAISYAASGSASSGFTNGTCAEYQTQANDNAANFGATAMTQWVMFDNAAPTFGSFSEPTALVQQYALTYGFAWSGSTDNASGVISYNLQAQTAPVVSGSCSATWTNSGSVVNQAGATYSLSTPTNATCYRLGVSPIDRATNGGSSYTYSAAILIDTHTPVTPPTPLLTTGSDTGTSNHDGLTTIHNGLIFTGTAEAASTVKVYADGSQLLGSGTATAGSYSITTTSDLSAGPHTITVIATDAAGTPSLASPAYPVVIHLTCPA